MRMLGRYFYRTMFGLAQVFETQAPDESRVRILKVGGVFQSATYLDERRFEPVFAYCRAFDAVFSMPVSDDGKEYGVAPVRTDGSTAHDEHGPRAARADAASDRLGPLCPQGCEYRPPRILMLGGGGYAWPKHVLATRPEALLDVVEIDPAITEIARKHFFLDEAIERFDGEEPRRLRTFAADGREFLEHIARCGTDRDTRTATASTAPEDDADARRYECGETRAPYDAIVNDAFSGMEPVASLATVEAAQMAKGALTPNGLYLMNVVSESGGSDLGFLRDLTATLLRAFEHVHIVPCPDDDFGGEDNYLVVATDGTYAFDGSIPFDEDLPGKPMFDRTD